MSFFSDSVFYKKKKKIVCPTHCQQKALIALFICNSCASVSTVLQLRRHSLCLLETAEVKCMFCVSELNETVFFQTETFLKGMWIMPKKMTEIHHFNVLIFLYCCD